MNNEEKILNLLEKMNERFDKVDERLANVEKSQEEMRGEINQINTRLSNLEKSQEEIKEKVDYLDQHLLKVEVTQENTVLPRLDLLAEGQVTIQKQIKKLSVVDALQDDVATLKSAVKYLSDEIIELKTKIA